MNEALLETLRLAQRLGFFGAAPIESAVDHALGYVTALTPLGSGVRIVDLGSGGGLPGLVLAEAFPECSVMLTDRRTKRTDFLSRAVSRLGLTNTRVRVGDVEELIREVDSGVEPAFGVVTARGFGPPELTLRTAVALLGGTGVVLISEPPSGDRWNSELIAELGLHAERRGAVQRFERR